MCLIDTIRRIRNGELVVPPTTANQSSLEVAGTASNVVFDNILPGSIASDHGGESEVIPIMDQLIIEQPSGMLFHAHSFVVDC